MINSGGKMKRITQGSRTLIILGTVQGLVSERKKVRDAYTKLKPEVVALPISEEMITGLRAAVRGEVKEVQTSSIDDLFAEHLRRFGEVQIPPPSLAEALELAEKYGAKVVALDMNEEEYSDAYVKYVSSFHFWARIWRLRRLKKKTFSVDTPEDFVVMWDRYISRLKGYASLERARERFMAERALELLENHTKVLALVEHERLEGVIAEIRRLEDEKKL